MMVSEQEAEPHTERTRYRQELQMSQIEQALLQHDNSANRVQASTESDSSLFAFRSQLVAGVTSLRALAVELKDALLVDTVHVGKDDGLLQAKVAHVSDAPVPLLALLDQAQSTAAATALLGYSESGQVVMFDPGDRNTPHLLIAGSEAAGKTSLLRSTAVALALSSKQSEVQFVAICPIDGDRERQSRHEQAWKPLNYLPHMLCDVAFRQSDIRELLLFLIGELAYREKQSFQHPYIIVFIDQLDLVLERGGAEAAKAIYSLVQRGEDVGIHLVVSTANCESPMLSPQLRSGLALQVIGRSPARSISRVISSELSEDPAQLLGEGDFLLCTGGAVCHFQAAFVDDYDLHLALNTLYLPKKRLLAMPESTRVRLATGFKAADTRVQFVDYPAGEMSAD